MGSRACLAMTMIAVLSCGQTRIEGDTGGDMQVEFDDRTEIDGAEDDVPSSSQCPTGFGPFVLVECGGYCLYLGGNAAHCGACGNACATDEACISGVCVDLCDEIDVSTTSALASLLVDLSWVSTIGVMRYAVASADVSIASSDLGDGYILVPDMEGLVLGTEIVYGFEDLPVEASCWLDHALMYPSTGYDSLTLPAGTSFIARFDSYSASEPYYRCSDEYYCIYMYFHPMDSCCCASEPFLWNLVTIAAAPEVCTEGADACTTGLAGTNHSLCYSSYSDYMTGVLPVHVDCVEHEHGHVLPGRGCSCFVVYGDVGETLEGTCTMTGMCDVGLSSHPHSSADRGCV